jgi:hypothetical protein
MTTFCGVAAGTISQRRSQRTGAGTKLQLTRRARFRGCKCCDYTTPRSTLIFLLIKNILLFRIPKSAIHLLPSLPTQKGAFAVVTDAGRGMRWTRDGACDESTVRGWQNRVVLTPSRRCQVSVDETLTTVATERGSPRRSRISRKLSRAGMSGNSGGLVVANSCVYLNFTREAAGALGARHSPRPFGAELKCKTRAIHVARSSTHIYQRHCEEQRDEAIQLPYFAAQRKLDCFAEPVIGRAFARPGGSQ